MTDTRQKEPLEIITVLVTVCFNLITRSLMSHSICTADEGIEIKCIGYFLASRGSP